MPLLRLSRRDAVPARRELPSGALAAPQRIARGPLPAPPLQLHPLWGGRAGLCWEEGGGVGDVLRSDSGEKEWAPRHCPGSILGGAPVITGASSWSTANV